MKIAEIEYTPNPNAVKFVLKDSITPMGVTRSFDTHDSAKGVPLAQHLLAIDSVLTVFFADRWITITQDGTSDWPQLLRSIAEPIRAAEPGDALIDPSVAVAQEYQGAEAGVGLDDPRLPMIRDIVDEHIMPFLASDGGGLEIVAFVDNRLMIRYQGACGTCPASLTGTLMAIENLIQMEIDPEIEVVTV
jgi:Fe-S cluster biogenesis protein NfuA